MSWSLLEYFVEQIRTRVQRLLWGEIALQAETDALLNFAAQLSRLETQAVAYEAAGQPQLAIILRERATQLALENPAATATRLQAAVTPDAPSTPSPALSVAPRPAPTKPTSSRSAANKRRGRPRKPAATGPEVDPTEMPAQTEGEG